MTTSISSAPASTELRISLTRSRSGESPAGKPVETAATWIPLPSTARRAVSTNVIDAHRRNLNPEALHPKFLREFLLNRLPRLRAQAPHALVGVIAGKRGQVHTGDGAKQPSGLPFLLHRSPRDQRLRAALDRAGIHAHRVNPIQIERDAAVGLQVAPGVLRNGGVGRRDRTRHSNGKPVGI